MICPNCHKQLPDSAVFCDNCGTPIRQSYSHQTNHPYGQSPQGKRSNVIPALAYIPILFWLPLITDQDNPIGRPCSNQGLLLLLLSFAINILEVCFNFAVSIPTFGLAIHLGNLIFFLIRLGCLSLTIIGIVKAAGGTVFKLPVIGSITLIK